MPLNNDKPVTTSFLQAGYRASGILMHVTSLPSPYGIGDLGPSAFEWIDQLAACGQSWWQILPLGPTGPGNSPYDPHSTFAGNILLISPAGLVDDGLIEMSACREVSFSESSVDYDTVTEWKQRLVEVAWSNFQAAAPSETRRDFQQFCDRQAEWLDDYALFCALKQRHQADHYLDLPDELVWRDQAALVRAKHEFAVDIDGYRFGQFLFFRQWEKLKRYANQRGVQLMGDLPFFVSPDSADVWAQPELFMLDERFRPRFAAGVPPDYFSPTGQLWGNPIYDWDVLKRDGYGWWIDRMRALLSNVDVIRLDHFRAFVAAWHIPADATTAESGTWVLGPGAVLFQSMLEAFGHLPFLAEDLGSITDDVCELRDRFQLPGMRVLQFAFDGKPNNPFLPEYYVANSVAYTGTHDNNTTRGWYDALREDERQIVWRSLNLSQLPTDQVAGEFMRLIWSSESAIAIAPLQDVLNLGADARMNVPGSEDGNWKWRCTPEMLADVGWQQLRDLTEQSGRLPAQSQVC